MDIDDKLNIRCTKTLDDTSGDASNNEELPNFQDDREDVPGMVDVEADLDAEIRNFMPPKPSSSDSRLLLDRSDGEISELDNEPIITSTEKKNGEARQATHPQ